MDVATEITGVADVKQFGRWLEGLIPNAVTPYIEWDTTTVTDNGLDVYITFVAASDLPPHQATLASRAYYMRLAGQCAPMEHHMVADMFLRRRRPVLVPILRSGTRKSFLGPNMVNQEWFHLAILNQGRGTAHYPYCLARSTIGSGVLGWDAIAEGARVFQRKDGLEWMPGIARVIYPDTHHWIGVCKTLPDRRTDIEVSGEIYAEEIRPLHFEYRIVPGCSCRPYLTET